MTADAVYFIMYTVPSPLASNRTNQNYLCNSYYAPILVIPNLPVNCFLQSMEPVHSANSTFSSQRTQSPSSHLLLAADAAACFFCSCWLMHAWPSYQVIRSILWWTALAVESIQVDMITPARVILMTGGCHTGSDVFIIIALLLDR